MSTIDDLTEEKELWRVMAGERAIEIVSLKAEVAEWKANHADMVKRNRLFIERLDMPVERVQAHEALVTLQKDNDSLKAERDVLIDHNESLCMQLHRLNKRIRK